MNTNSTCSSCGYGSNESRYMYVHKVGPCKYSTGSLSVCASYPSLNTPCNLMSCQALDSGLVRPSVRVGAWHHLESQAMHVQLHHFSQSVL